jgi:uncharacterized protein involved in type VI secretion and phage assembly
MTRTPFYGKYRGVVQDNADPLALGRIIAQVPDVYGDLPSGWALPSLPASGVGMGIFAIPGIGANVWIEFEQGDPIRPIWSGCFWGTTADDAAAVPEQAGLMPGQKIVLKSGGGTQIVLDDTPGTGGITLQLVSGDKLALTSEGITLQTAAGDKLSLSADGVSLQTSAGDKLSLAPQGVTLQTAAGQKLGLAPEGVSLDSGAGGTVKITGPKVALNDSALEVI